MFIDASAEYQPGKNQNILRDEDVQHLVDTYKAFQEEEKYASVVTLEEITENDYNLNI